MYRRLRISTMFEWFQEGSITHTEELGCGREKTLDKGLLWVVTLQRAEIARLPIPVLILYGGHDTFIGAEKIDQIITERNRLNSSITKSVMVAGAGYLEEYGINKNLYIDTVNSFLNSYYKLDEV